MSISLTGRQRRAPELHVRVYAWRSKGMKKHKRLSPIIVNALFCFGILMATAVFYTTVADVLDGSTRLPSKFTPEDNIFLSLSPLAFYATIFIRLLGGTAMAALAVLLKRQGA